MSNEIPKGRKSRLFSMAAKIAMQQGQKYLKNNPDSKLHILMKQADTLVSTVGQLKGAAMKAVQTITVEGQDFLPPEVMQILEKLQSQAPPISNEVLMKELKEQLGEEKFSRLENLSTDPIASASIGQVYQATINGEPVVVKIQYPGVAESVDEDIDTLKKLLKGLLLVSGKTIDFNDLMEEVRRVLKLETNYEYELKSLQKYKELFKGSNYHIPDVYPEFSTKKVIVMSKEEGLEFGEWVKTNPEPEKKKKISDDLLFLFIKEFFENKLVQTDPNPANFLVNEKGEMVLLDFGATLEFDEAFIKEYQKLVRVVFSKNRKDILSHVLEMGLIKPQESNEAKDAFVEFLILSLHPFKDELQPFDFANKDYADLIRQEAFKFSKLLKYSAPPKKLIFLNRKLGGVFNLLKKMDVKADLTEFKKIMLEKDFV